MSSSFGPAELGAVSYPGPLGACGVKRTTLSSTVLPQLESVIVSSDQTTLGPTVAFPGMSWTSSGATNKNNMDKKLAENIKMKYFVASRRIMSKIPGLAGYPIILDLLAVNAMIENARTSNNIARL